MDVETAGAIEQLSARIDAVEVSLRAEFRAGLAKLGSRFDAMEPRFDGLESRFDGLESRFDGLESRFDGLESRFDTMESHFDTMESGLEARFAESRRHTDVLVESLRDDIRMLAEAFATLTARLDSGRR
jgi:hypothetical protein